MKPFLSSLAVLSLLTSAALAAAGWGENYEKALAQAKAEKKMVLLDFTGSDWCGGCIQLDKEVFAKTEFKEYAKKNLVLLEVDFPISKAQSDEVKAQNQKLERQYRIEGYPTLVVLNAEGKEVARWMGYQGGGPSEVIVRIEALKK